jgi:hypothetical protein
MRFGFVFGLRAFRGDFNNLSEIGFAVWALEAVITSVFSGL